MYCVIYVSQPPVFTFVAKIAWLFESLNHTNPCGIDSTHPIYKLNCKQGSREFFLIDSTPININWWLSRLNTSSLEVMAIEGGDYPTLWDHLALNITIDRVVHTNCLPMDLTLGSCLGDECMLIRISYKHWVRMSSCNLNLLNT